MTHQTSGECAGMCKCNCTHQMEKTDIEPKNLVFLKTYKTNFADILITFTDQNGRPLEKEDKVNLTLLINRDGMLFYRTKNKKVC